jgi:hypothetical protein
MRHMGLPVVSTGMMMCSFGVAPSTLNVIPQAMVMMENKPAATIFDNIPMVNIPPFGMCQSLANPMVAAATAAALGVLTPMPCLPVIAAPWAPGSPTVMIGNKPALNNSSQCMCNWGGAITISFAGTTTEQIP